MNQRFIKKLSDQQIKKICQINPPMISKGQRDEMAIPSYTHSNPLIRWLMWKRYETIARMAQFHKTFSALEFGCGVGLFLPELSSKCETVFAIDIFPQYAIHLCNSLKLDVTFVTDIKNIADGSLDTIIAADVLEHIEEPELTDLINQFHIKLKPKADFIVSGPTENFLYKIGRHIAGFGDKGDYHHTNIDKLFVKISKKFKLREIRELPFSSLPALFKVGRFTT